jgi:hypothetical protein
MPDPLMVKTAVKTTPSTQGATGEKGGGSKFRDVQAKVKERAEQAVDLPAEVKGVSAAQRRTLEADLQRKLAQSPNATPNSVLRPQMQKIQSGVKDLSRKVAALPKTAAFDPVRARLSNIESRYKESRNAIGKIGNVQNPQQLLNMQVGMYELTQNIEIVSKVVEQVNSGVKQILQTQL